MIQMTKLKAEGELFFRGRLSAGGKFREAFAVIERGKLDLYAKRKDYIDHENSINDKPIKLWNYKLETSYR